MYCPYCGKKNDDSATYCAGCGKYIKEDPDSSEPEQPVDPDPFDDFDDFDDGGGNQNRGIIIAIIIIAAAAVVAILFLMDVLPWSFLGGNVSAETEKIEETESAAGDSAAGAVESTDETKAEDKEKEKETPVNPDKDDTEEQKPDGAKTTAEYTIETKHASEKDSKGNTVVSADYELVILQGDDGVNQKINDSLEQDCQDFLDYYGSSEDEAAIENDSADNMQQKTSAAADVVYDKNGVLSIFYEIQNENSATTHSYAYGLTYSLETGDQMQITDLADESDAEVLEKMKEALLVDQSTGYLSGTEAQINALTLNDVDNEDNGLGLHFIVEGGEIVLVVSGGDLFSSGSGFLKVPIQVYISNMSYDEYKADYIFPDSDSRYLKRADLEGLSKEELRLARNEIFARHGRLYEDENLNAYFSKRSWYNGTLSQEEFDQSVFNDYERTNLDTLNDYEGEMGYQNIGAL